MLLVAWEVLLFEFARLMKSEWQSSHTILPLMLGLVMHGSWNTSF